MKLKDKLYLKKVKYELIKGALQGKIVQFDEEFYKSMSTTYFSCVPISMHIKYLKPLVPPGKCYDRSMYMFFCFDDALLVTGDNKDLETRYGKGNGGHGWIEKDGYVYDPSLLLRFDKELYYKIYEPTNINKRTKEEFNRDTNNYYDMVKETSIDDFKIGGEKRADLCVMIPLLKEISEKNEEFKKELDEYLKEIEYDEKQVYEALNEKFFAATKKVTFK